MTSSGKQEEVMRVIAIEILRMLSSLQCRGGVSSHYVILPGHWTCDVEITVPEHTKKLKVREVMVLFRIVCLLVVAPPS